MSSNAEHKSRREQLARTNPLFGPAQLKLGTFCSNLSNGGCISTLSGVLELNWRNAARLARLADEMNFEAIVPVARWRGFGGVTDANGQSYETMTFAAAAAVTTTYSSVFSTVNVPTLHPVMAAKQCSTIDHISSGRFSLNITAGWNAKEIELFGAPIKEHDDRYEVASEWVQLIKELWTSEEPVNFDGRFYSVRDAYLRPQPVQPYPALMSAGASSRGRAFAAEHMDVGFTAFSKRDPESMRALVDDYRKLAWERFGRTIDVWSFATVIIGDTQADAERQLNGCLSQGDYVAVDNLFRSMNMTNQSIPADVLTELTHDFVVGWGGYRIVGKKEMVVEELDYLRGIGVDGILLTFPRFLDGMEQFSADVHPLLVEAGLRN